MYFPIPQLGSAGVITDSPAQDLPPNAFTDGLNVKFRRGKVRKEEGWEVVEMAATPDYQLDNTSYWFQTWLGLDGQYRTVFCSSTALELYESAASSGAVSTFQEDGTTPVSLTASSDWQTDVYGNFVILSNEQDIPMEMDDGTKARELPGWRTQFGDKAAQFVRTYDNFLVAALADDPFTVYWSDSGGVTSLPDDWDYTSTTNNAGRNILQASDGELVDCLPLRGVNILYTQFGCYRMARVTDAAVMRFRRLFSWGAMNRNCVQEFDGMHFVVGNNAIYAHDGVQIIRIADPKVEERFFSEVGRLDRVHVAKYDTDNELVISYPVGSDTFATKKLTYNWRTNTWSFGDYPFAVSCVKPSFEIRPGFTIDEMTGTIDELALSIDEYNASADPVRRMYLLSDRAWFKIGDRYTRDENVTSSTVDSNQYYAYVQRDYLDLDEIIPNSLGVVKDVNTLYLQVAGAGTINVQVGGSDTVGGAIVWDDVQQFDIATDYKVDVRANGRYIHYRIGSWEGTALSGNWRLTGLALDVTLEGQR